MKKLLVVIVVLVLLVSAVVFKTKLAPELVKKRVWGVLQEYLIFAQAHYLESLRGLSHQISDTCNDVEKRKECDSLMDNAYAIGRAFQKEDFNIIQYDKKQIILSTNYTSFAVSLLNSTSTYYTRSIIYFTRDEDGKPKVLSFNPSDGVGMTNSTSTQAEVDTKLKAMTLDSDDDGLPDEMETNTDPSKKDTGGDGWWDSIETLFYKS